MSEIARTTIHFYSTIDEYGCLSNFSPHVIRLGGKAWPTTEHYFQAQKFPDADHVEKIRLARTPAVAKQLGRSRTVPLRPDWEAVKEQVMLDALRAKFAQHDDLRAILLGTGDALLVEHTASDRYWGDGGDGSGRNRLGHLLMQLREELRST
jgi:hypothetical protein